MSELIPSRRPLQSRDAPDTAWTLSALATTLFVVLAVAILYFAREILVPIAIAILLSFVLAPFVKLLRKIGLGKTLAVGVVVFTAFLVAVGLGAILARQISDLASEAPRYQLTVTHKIETVQTFLARNPIFDKINAVVEGFGKLSPVAPRNEPSAPAKSPASTSPPTSATSRGSEPAKAERAPASPLQPSANTPVRVEIVPPPPGVLAIVQMVVGVAASPVVTAAFVAIFIVFILMQREDLRNRFIRLVGSGDLQLTTLAMNDAARRLSRYFLAQVLLNTAFGVVVAVALELIGVPSAILWGIVATFMRFVPYVGSIGAAIFPVAMAAVASSGWTMVIETVALFALSEFIVGQLIEPLVYGRNTGISPIAVVASATFWTWLWGPVGLVLATPLTVCLVVMGRHVDRLAFLDVLLGDAPPLTPVEAFYQRMLAGDPSEIVDDAESFLREHTLVEYCHRVAMPALLMAQFDVRRGVLEDKRQSAIRDALRDLVDHIMDEKADVLPLRFDPDDAPASLEEPEAHDAEAPTSEMTMPDVEIAPAWREEGAIVCVAGRTPLDEAAARLLADLVRIRGVGTRVEASEILTADAVEAARLEQARLIVLSFLDADLSTAQARFAVRRLRRRAPGVPIVTAFWMSEDDEARASALCDAVRADECVSSMPLAVKRCLERAAAPASPEPAAPPTAPTIQLSTTS